MEKLFIKDEIENSCKNLLEALYSQIHTLATFNNKGEDDAALDDVDYINQLLFI